MKYQGQQIKTLQDLTLFENYLYRIILIRKIFRLL